MTHLETSTCDSFAHSREMRCLTFEASALFLVKKVIQHFFVNAPFYQCLASFFFRSVVNINFISLIFQDRLQLGMVGRPVTINYRISIMYMHLHVIINKIITLEFA